MADDDRIARILAGVSNVQRMPGRAAIALAQGFGDLVERAKTESTSAALGGDYNPQPVMELATGAIGGGTPFAVRGALGAAGGKIVQPQGIRAYHGSPHDFERFDMSKIGTGEGAQAYGHGLYFAEKEAVARDYRRRLAPNEPVNVKPDEEATRKFASEWEGLVKQRRDLAGPRGTGDTSAVDTLMNAVHEKMVADTIARNPNLAGRMYEVNIRAEPQQFLDWDKPLAQMAPEVQAQLSGFSPHMTGAQINESARLVPGAYRDNTIATANLRERGIPGIKYLDQGSRGVGDIGVKQLERGWLHDQGPGWYVTEGGKALPSSPGPFATRAEADAAAQSMRPTSNYVLFRDDIIDILRKYGIAVPPTGAALANQGRVADALAGEPQ